MKRWLLFALLIVAFACVGAYIVFSNHSGGPPQGKTLVDLLPSIASGDAEAAARAKALARKDWPAALPTVAGMLGDNSPDVRAVGCEIIAGTGDEKYLPLLVVRASDSDWRVRSAAFAALWKFRNPGREMPLKNTPMDEREQLLLHWLAQYDAAAARPLMMEICEIYAADSHVELARPMTQRCLECHTGTPQRPMEFVSDCAKCHQELFDEWAGSAHANTLTHLRLTTVDPVSRTTTQVTFGDVKGMTCVQCHKTVSTPTGPESQAATCPVGPFKRADSQSCASCHGGTYRQWQAWAAAPHPQRLDWPPGQIDLTAENDNRNCLDCHMKPAQTADDKPYKQHRWAARRDVELLKAGLVMECKTAGSGDGRKLAITLTNLSGHQYPTGTRRRALAVWVSLDEGEAKLSAMLCPDRPGQLWLNCRPALANGETRTIEVPLPAGTKMADIILIYYRNVFDASAYSTEIMRKSAEVDLGKGL